MDIKGISAFSFDTNFFDSPAIKCFYARLGLKGESLLIRILCDIYKHGYYIEFNKDYSHLLALDLGNKNLYSLINDVIYEAVKRDIFDKDIFDSFKVLTSREVQENYIRVAKERTKTTIIREYWLIDIPNSNKLHIETISPPRNSVSPPRNELQRSNNININNNNNINNKYYVATSSPEEKKKNPKVFETDSIEFVLSKRLADAILLRNPNAKVPKSDNELFKWCVYTDYIIRLDKRPVEEVKEVLEFAIKDTFWSSNILSTRKLREQYDKLFFKMQNSKNTRFNTNNSLSSSISVKQEEETKKKLNALKERLRDANTKSNSIS